MIDIACRLDTRAVLPSAVVLLVLSSVWPRLGILGTFFPFTNYINVTSLKDFTDLSRPIGIMIGDYGADLGIELGFLFSAVAYPPLRYIELKFFPGR